MSNMTHSSRFTSDPVVGQHVTGVSTGRRGSRVKYTTEWSGVYQGIKSSEWDGTPVHFFSDGVVGTTPQRCFTLPVDRFDTSPVI